MQNGKDLLEPDEINGQTVEMLDAFKYPGSGIDGDLPFKENTSHIFVAVRRSESQLSVRAWWTVFCLLTPSCDAVI